MKQDSFNSNLTSLNHRNQLQTYAITLLSIVLAISVWGNISTHDRLVFVPQGLPANASVSWDVADEVYMNMTAVGVAQLIGSIDPKNLQFIVDSLSNVLDASLYTDVRKKLLAKAKSQAFLNSGSSTSFKPTEKPIFEPAEDGHGGTSFVFGEQSLTNYYSKVEKRPFVYEISLRIVDGRPIIYGIDAYAGNDAHTSDWKSKHPEYKGHEGEQN